MKEFFTAEDAENAEVRRGPSSPLRCLCVLRVLCVLCGEQEYEHD